MKVRNGFVSNSSSQSFVIGNAGDELFDKAKKAIGEKSLGVKDIALIFLEEVTKEEMNDFGNDEEDSQRRLSQRRELKKARDDIKYVKFDSFNENTYIYYYDNNIVVETTRNLDLSSAVDRIEKTHKIWGEEEGYPFNYDPDVAFNEEHKLEL